MIWGHVLYVQLLEGALKSHSSRQSNRVNAANFKFHLVIALAHEIVHLFIGYLTPDKRVSTPPSMAPQGTYGRSEAESGRFWEELLLGGQLEMWFDRNAPEAPGMPYLMLPRGSQSTTTRLSQLICPSYIQETISRRESKFEVLHDPAPAPNRYLSPHDRI